MSDTLKSILIWYNCTYSAWVWRLHSSMDRIRACGAWDCGPIPHGGTKSKTCCLAKALERSHSGLVRSSRKALCAKAHRGFKSHPLRQNRISDFNILAGLGRDLGQQVQILPASASYATHLPNTRRVHPLRKIYELQSNYFWSWWYCNASSSKRYADFKTHSSRPIKKRYHSSFLCNRERLDIL